MVKIESSVLVQSSTGGGSLYTNLAVVPVEITYQVPLREPTVDSFAVTNGTIVGGPTKAGPQLYILDINPTTDGLVEVSLRTDVIDDNSKKVTSNILRFTVDRTPPTIAIGSVSPTYGDQTIEFVWSVTYTDADEITLQASDVTLHTTGTVSGCTVSVSLSDLGENSRNVKVTNCTGEGDVDIELAAGTARDLAGNTALSEAGVATATVGSIFQTQEIVGANGAFAALKTNGSVAVWGVPISGGAMGGSGAGWTGAPASVTAVNSGVLKVYANYQGQAFAALKADGSVVVWGGESHGGSMGGSGVGWTGAPASVTDPNSDVAEVYTSSSAFAAVKTDGSVVVWGGHSSGGSMGGSGTGWVGAPAGVTDAGSGVVKIVSSGRGAFAALKSNGSVVVWGVLVGGGMTGGSDPGPGPGFGWTGAPASVTNAGSGVVKILANNGAFAAVKGNGAVVVWGYEGNGGSMSGSGFNWTRAPDSMKATNTAIRNFATKHGFLSVVTPSTILQWGANNDIAPAYVTASGELQNVIYNGDLTGGAMAGLLDNGSVVVWGEDTSGGNMGGSGAGWTGAPASVTDPNSDVTKLATNYGAFAALKSDGSVVVWGSQQHGGAMGGSGTIPSNWVGAPTSVTAANSNVTHVVAARGAFAALKGDGTVVTWGLSNYGGNSSGVVFKSP
jgi:alpha-tubulin suppressor-like RCC1 family protein